MWCSCLIFHLSLPYNTFPTRLLHNYLITSSTSLSLSLLLISLPNKRREKEDAEVAFFASLIRINEMKCSANTAESR